MKEKFILLSTDGPDENVIKIKPPMPFSLENVDYLIKNLDEEFMRI
jgi:4-aminobutyrate aminotransferase-like enzyme